MSKKARLSGDVVGTLKDRIEDDPLDYDAYLSLIAHHRERSNLDDARDGFQKLLAVVPDAVCPPLRLHDLR